MAKDSTLRRVTVEKQQVLSMDQKDKHILCNKCGVELENKEIGFKYLGFEFSAEAACCPQCGQTYLSEEIATGKLAEIERMLEDK